MSGLSIRQAHQTEEDAVRRIVDAAYAPLAARMDQLPGPMQDDYGLRITQGVVFVLTDEAEIFGILVLVDQPDAMLLENVAVDPQAHGRGYGRRLIDHAEAEARRRGYDRIRLYTHVTMIENQRMYPRLGYVEIARNTQHGFERVHYEKSLCA